jgi:UDP:flavonoid glycosyltransferase YjiC (YdhE family)
MRILFSSTGGAGHFSPLVPWIELGLSRGHEVLVVGPAKLAEAATRFGYPTRVGASPSPAEVAPVWAQVATMNHDDAGPLVIGEVFCRLNSGALLPAVRAACDEWAPHLVLRDPTEFASAVAAEERGIRHVRIAHGLAAGEAGSLQVAAPALQSFLPGLDQRITESPYLTLFPEMLDPSPFVDTWRYRLPASDIRPSQIPNSWPGHTGPLIYVTFGTVAPTMPGTAQLFRAVMDAVAGLPTRVLITVGHDLDTAELGTPAPNVRIERWVDQADVLAEASLMVCHGGAGTTLGALAAGVPMVVFPLFADQAANAACVVTAGAGVSVEAQGAAAAIRAIESSDTAALRSAILQVLNNPKYARAGADIRSAFHALPVLNDAYQNLLPSPLPN